VGGVWRAGARRAPRSARLPASRRRAWTVASPTPPRATSTPSAPPPGGGARSPGASVRSPPQTPHARTDSAILLPVPSDAAMRSAATSATSRPSTPK